MRVASVVHLIAGPDGRGVRYQAGGTDLATGVDCKALAWHALQACGKDVPWHSLVGGDDLSEEAMEGYFASQEELWEEVPEANQLGDLVVSLTESGPHFSVLVDAPARKVITIGAAMAPGADPAANLAHLAPLWAIQSRLRVMRFRGRAAR